MYCNICGNREISLNIFKVNMCKMCFKEITNIDVVDEEYDKYKNLVRIFLSYYIEPRKNIDNLVF
ncbi:MAG TPA: hypothetical protein VK087_05850 [Tissierellaceae bacterium]|nr:hypothetical protein [Tissierellaceae bacterium]